MTVTINPGYEANTVPSTHRYRAGSGRWISRDPIAERGGLNLYGYVHDDPIDAYDPDGMADLKVNGQIWKTPIQGDMGHPHLFNGVDQGIHLHGPDGMKYFPQSNMMMDKNGNWFNAGNSFKKQFQRSARCQLNQGLLNSLGLLSLLASMVINAASGQTDENVRDAINNINMYNQTGEDQYAVGAAAYVQAAFSNDIAANIVYSQLTKQ